MDYIIKSIIPIIIGIIVAVGMKNGVKVYECFIEGAKDGLKICLKIFPYLLAMLVAVGVLRNSGLLSFFIKLVTPLVKFIGLAPELVPLVMMKPLSGSGALGIFADTLTKYGADTNIGKTASIIMGSTETIFYTLTVYYGAVKIKKIRHTVWAAIIADITAVITAITLSRFIM